MVTQSGGESKRGRSGRGERRWYAGTRPGELTGATQVPERARSVTRETLCVWSGAAISEFFRKRSAGTAGVSLTPSPPRPARGR